MTLPVSLKGKRLLVVEDEVMIAFLVEDILEDLGCVVAGVAGTVAQGLSQAGDDALHLDGAILDVNLGGEMVFPIADLLKSRGIPFLFATGYGAPGDDRYPDAPVMAKPFTRMMLERQLAKALG